MGPAGDGDSVTRLLELYNGLTRRAALQAVPAREPRRPLYDLLSKAVGLGGKGLRPALCIAVCRAQGGSTEEALPFAVALEMLHASFLIHDDIEDCSRVRRGRPTMNAEHGVALALNAGDALAVLAGRAMAAACRPLGPAGAGALEAFAATVIQSLEGQAVELEWRRSGIAGVTESDYLSMVAQKTAAYTVTLPLRLGALAATRRLDQPERFAGFGFYLGALFQIRDDFLSLWPGAAGLGKAHAEDIAEGKPTLMTIHLLSRVNGSERRRLLKILGAGPGSVGDSDVDWVIGLMEANGSRQRTLGCCQGLAAAAGEEFQAVFAGTPPSPDLDFVGGLAAYLIHGLG